MDRLNSYVFSQPWSRMVHTNKPRRILIYQLTWIQKLSTITTQKLYQKNVGNGDSENSNCGQNTIRSLAVEVCQDLPFIDGLGGGPGIQ
jgi:hypothetical protein